MLLALTIVILPLLLVSDPQSPDRSLLWKVLSWGRHAVGLERGFGRQQAAPDAAEAAPTADDGAADNPALRLLAKRLPGAEPFAAPEIARALKLTDQQQARLGDLLKATGVALQEMDDRWQNEARHAHAARRQHSSSRPVRRP